MTAESRGTACRGAPGRGPARAAPAECVPEVRAVFAISPDDRVTPRFGTVVDFVVHAVTTGSGTAPSLADAPLFRLLDRVYRGVALPS